MNVERMREKIEGNRESIVNDKLSLPIRHAIPKGKRLSNASNDQCKEDFNC
jgi:hypothetical protein